MSSDVFLSLNHLQRICVISDSASVISTETVNTQEYSVAERRSRSYFLEGAGRNGFPGPFPPDIGITNTTPLGPNFGPLFAFQNLFQEKNSGGYIH